MRSETKQPNESRVQTELPPRQPVIPSDSAHDRPLLSILTILSFLAALSLLAALASLNMISSWQNQAQNAASVQILPDKDITQPSPAQIQSALDILRANRAVRSAAPLDKQEALELLSPWLGDTDLPQDIPMPIFISVTLQDGVDFDTQQTRLDLEAKGLAVIVEDHKQWRDDQNKSLRTFQFMAILCLVLIFAAVFLCALYVTRASMAGHRKTIDVLGQVGATPNYMARLFCVKYGLISAKAALLGTGLAVVLCLLMTIFSAAIPSGIFAIPRHALPLSQLWMTLWIPCLVTLLSVGASWVLLGKSLRREVYP